MQVVVKFQQEQQVPMVLFQHLDKFLFLNFTEQVILLTLMPLVELSPLLVFIDSTLLLVMEHSQFPLLEQQIQLII
jgi:hypothetical protein